ncbi:MAG: nuclear transport factor 2 family protein [Candidatus Sulfotelmatobacter sp.]
MKRVLASVVALFFVALLGSHVAARGNDTQREAQDRAQIEKLMWRYVRALDTENADAYAATYTPDGQFGSGVSATKGREALKKMIMDLRQRNADAEAKSGTKRPPMYHVLTNSYLEFVDKDHAHMEAYWMTVFAQGGPNVPVRVAAAGREVDELVRVNGQWLIKTRDVAPKD